MREMRSGNGAGHEFQAVIADIASRHRFWRTGTAARRFAASSARGTKGELRVAGRKLPRHMGPHVACIRVRVRK